MEKCQWYGCLAGSGPQTQWLASVRRQRVTLLILDKRQVCAGVWGHAVIVFGLHEIRCCDPIKKKKKWRQKLHCDVATRGHLKNNGEQCRHPVTEQHKMAPLGFIVQRPPASLDSRTKEWAAKTRTHMKNTKRPSPVIRSVVPTKCGKSGTEPFHPRKPHFSAFDLVSPQLKYVCVFSSSCTCTLRD